MGYLDNSSITVDAVLTKKGRDILSKGGEAFKITKFSLSDDEVDYSLWNPLHPSGSNYYGKVIENMPILEAIIDESQAIRYKLISIDSVLSTATQVNLPYVELLMSDRVGTITHGSTIAVNLSDSLKIISVSPITNYIINGTPVIAGLDTIGDGFGYTFLINKEAVSIINDSKGIFSDTSEFAGLDAVRITATTQRFSGDGDFTAVTRVGSALQLTIHGAGKVQTGATLPFLLPITVIGNQSGASFNFIISFDIPDNLKSTMGTGYEKPSVQFTAAVSRRAEDDREQEISDFVARRDMGMRAGIRRPDSNVGQQSVGTTSLGQRAASRTAGSDDQGSQTYGSGGGGKGNS